MPDLFARSEPVVSEIYRQIKAAAKACGAYAEEQKKTSLHLVRDETAFLGVRPQKSALVLTIKAAKGMISERIFKQERASANRWYFEVKLHSPDDVDKELRSWIRLSYELAGAKKVAARE